MARTHGFRVFVASAFPNRRQGNDPLDVSAGSATRDELVRLLEILGSRGTRFREPPAPREIGEPQLPVQSITVGYPLVVEDGFVHLSVDVGETGSHRRATQRGRAARDLTDWSPEASHFVAFVFPRTTNDKFVIVSQAARRRDPVLRLLRELRELSFAERRAAEERNRAEREEARAAGHRPPRLAKPDRLVFEIAQATDNGYLDEIIGAAKTASATFTSTAPSARGARPNSVQRTLRVSLLDDRQRDIGRAMGRSWARRRRQGSAPAPHEGVSELGGLLEEAGLLEENEADRYEAASINVRDQNGQSTTIAVDTLKDVFTYPVSEGPPTVEYFYDKVQARLRIIAREERLDIPVLDGREVARCLDDSIRDRSSAASATA